MKNTDNNFSSINFIALSQVNVDKKILKEVENLNINSESQIMDELKKRGKLRRC